MYEVIRGYIDQTDDTSVGRYKPRIDLIQKAIIAILLIHIIDKYKENLAGIKNICSMLQLLISVYISLHLFLWIL